MGFVTTTHVSFSGESNIFFESSKNFVKGPSYTISVDISPMLYSEIDALLREVEARTDLPPMVRVQGRRAWSISGDCQMEKKFLFFSTPTSINPASAFAYRNQLEAVVNDLFEDKPVRVRASAPRYFEPKKYDYSSSSSEGV